MQHAMAVEDFAAAVQTDARSNLMLKKEVKGLQVEQRAIRLHGENRDTGGSEGLPDQAREFHESFRATEKRLAAVVNDPHSR